MMRKFVSIIIVLCLFAVSRAEIKLEVIYPKPNRQIPNVDSTFIFGNVTKGANVRINGFDVPVYKDGGWLAFLPVSPGAFVFSITAITETDTANLDLPVIIGTEYSLFQLPRPLIASASVPDSDVIYSAGDIFEFSFRAPPGGAGWFSIGNRSLVPMFESVASGDFHPGSVFGEMSQGTPYNDGYISYTGYYRLSGGDAGRHDIRYRYIYPRIGLSVGSYYLSEYSTDSILMVIPEFPPLIGELSGRSQIIRTGPGLGYKLLYMPPGIKVQVTGAREGYYQFKLADNVTGYTNIDSVTLLPPGASIPKGRVSFISVDDSETGFIIKAETGQRLPFEINESNSPPKLEIDLFGVTGDVDWIRYNNENKNDLLVKWSQPADGIFRISAEFDDFLIGGYKPYYDGDTFILEISKKPKSTARFFTSVKGLKVVIDPGHSHDTGAVGPTGFPEKDANLWIAHELRQMLLREGAEVMMTRYGHENVALYDRPLMAEKWGADLLISIHNNALPDGINPFVNNGTSVYYYHPHSKPLAEAVHRHLVEATGLSDHGLYYGNLVLTRPTAMPAILVECAFMMIPEQEAMLKTDKFQRKCARAILDGIKDYLREN